MKLKYYIFFFSLWRIPAKWGAS